MTTELPRRRLAPQSTACLEIVYYPVSDLQADPRNARTHSKKQVAQIASSIKAFGFTNPILIDESRQIIAGHGRLAAARKLGQERVPTITVRGLFDAQRRALVIADNKIALNSGWDEVILAEELKFLSDAMIDLDGLTGFETVEIDSLVELLEPGNDTRADAIPEPPQTAVSRRGDVWVMDEHRLVCGDAKIAETFTTLMGGDRARIVLADSPYNVRICGRVSGLGRVQHREFSEASGEMTPEEFVQFLTLTMTLSGEHSLDGAIGFWFMDWAHMSEMLAAIKGAGLEHKQLVVWSKTNAGMGGFYRSQHELIFVTKHGTAAHVNNFGLGGHGRYRTNVWSYPGMNSFGRKRDRLLALHPTVKPVALAHDALKDVSHRGDIVLDPFGGSGTTLIAAEKCKRHARLIEIDPIYCDVSVRRWQEYTRSEARLASTNQTFAEVTRERTSV
jgi:hypothetical protein